jgi:hypothetical protein
VSATFEGVTTPVPTSEPLVGYTKVSEGPHGFPEAVQMPAEVVVDYVVRGSCTFTIEIRRDDATRTLAASLSVGVRSPGKSGAWSVRLKPDSYYLRPGEALGCTFDIAVYAG